MARVDAFVTEAPVDFKDALKAAHHEALEIKLGGNPQEQVHVKRVVMRHKGLGVGAARDGVEHRRFHFHEAVRLHVFADRSHNLGARFKARAAFRIDDEIGVALTAALFRILQALKFIGQRPDTLCEQPDFGDVHRELSAVGAEKAPLGGDNVPEVHRLKLRKRLIAHFARGDEVLHVACEVMHGRKGSFTHDALQHHAAGNGDFGLKFLEFFAAFVAKLGAQVPEKVLAHEIVGVGDTGFTQACELGTALGDDVVFILCRGCRGLILVVLFGHFLFFPKNCCVRLGRPVKCPA